MRDERWNLLRLFNIMSFSMFSCCHFRNFLCDPIGEQRAMSKRGQEATSSEVHRWRNRSQGFRQRRDPSIWCYADRGVTGKMLRRIWNIQSIWGMFSTEATGKCKKIQILGNRATGRSGRTLIVQGSLHGQRLQGQSFKH